MTRRRLLLLGVLAVLVAIGAYVGKWYEDLDDADGRFPSLIVIDEVAEELGAPLDPAVVALQDPDRPVRLQLLQPNSYRGSRRSLVAPAPAELRYRVLVPPGAVLRFGVGVATDDEESARGGTRFAVTVDGHERFTRVIDPVTRRREKRWFDEEVSLEPYAGRDVTVGLRTTWIGEGRPTGTPGWSRVQIVRQTRRERQPAAPDTPNVLLLLVDTLRADALGCYGATPSPSPTLDALAARGQVYDLAIAQAPWTLPSVTSILTGLYPRWHGVVGRSLQIGAPAGVSADVERGYLSDRLPTIATEASRAGITTFGVSSNALVSLENNLARGFERFIVLRADWKDSKWARAAAVHRSFLRWAGRNRDRRFFAYLHYMEAHDPYVPDPAFAPPDDPSLPADVRSGVVRNLADAIEQGAPPLPPPALDHLRGRYLGAVHAWDRGLAELLVGLEQLGLDDRTIVIVTADHGEEFQEHGHLGHRRHLYDESLRVPLVVVGPGIAAGRRGEQVEGVDVFPTVAHLLGVPVPAGLPGRDVLAHHIDERPALVETQYGLGPDGGNSELLGIRTPAEKLIWDPALDRYELFDLRADPGERVDRWSVHGDGTLAQVLERHRTTAPSQLAAGNGADPALLEKLHALGYVR